jgi:HEAT repeat protein
MRWFLAAIITVCICVSALGEVAPPAEVESAHRILQDGLESKDWTVRILAIQASGLIGSNEPLRKQLEAFVSDEEVDVRIAAIKTLADLKATESIPVIENRMTEDKTPEVKFAAAKALYVLNDPKGRRWLVDVYDDKEKASSDMLHSQTRKFMGNFHSLESASMFIMSEGIGYVPVPGVGAGFSAITGLINDPDLSPRAAALMLLAKDKNAETDTLLKKGLGDKDWSVRASAAQMIAFTARAGMQEELVPLFTDKSEKVRFRAAGAYLHMENLTSSKTTRANK